MATNEDTQYYAAEHRPPCVGHRQCQYVEGEAERADTAKRIMVEMQHRAEAAERALAELRGEVRAIANQVVDGRIARALRTAAGNTDAGTIAG